MNKLELTQEITKLEKELINPARTEAELAKIRDWKNLLEKDLKKYE